MSAKLTTEPRLVSPGSVPGEREFGTRSIARHIVRAGIQISETSVRRILEEEVLEPKRATHRQAKVTSAPQHIQHPTAPRRVWHLDLTGFGLLWWREEIAAVIDGFCRRLVALKMYDLRPTTEDLAGLVVGASEASGGGPRFIVTDHGSQFRKRFTGALGELGIVHVRCQIHTWHLNAKVERVFRDVKAWLRRTWLIPRAAEVQPRLDAYRYWHNSRRPHAAHGPRTPMEAEHGIRLPIAIAYRQRDGPAPLIKTLERRYVRGDPRLICPKIKVVTVHQDAA